MEVSLQGFKLQTYKDLLVLNDSTVDLSNQNCHVIISIDSFAYDAQILNGYLLFKRVQNLLVDTEQVEVILSGEFEFHALINNEPITVSDGRFDVGIGEGNFYSY